MHDAGTVRAWTASMNILVIDDDASLRRTLRMSLEVLGHQAVEARDGAQALELLGHRPFEMALLDLRLAQEQGLDLLPRLLGLGPRPACGDRHGLCHHRNGGRGHAARGLRLPAQAVHAGSASRGPRPDRPHATAAIPSGRVGGAGSLGRAGGGPADERAEDARGPGRGLQDRGQRGDHPAARRERHRQGSPGPGDPCPQPAGRRSVRHRSLPKSLRRTPGERTVRARAGRVHRARCGTRWAR